MTKYDDATDLPDDSGATHMGMFLAWAVQRGLISELHIEESPQLLEAIKLRTMTGTEFLWERCDGKLTEDDFTDVGNAFARTYYLNQEGDYGEYFVDYRAILVSDLSSFYHVADSWENFAKLKPVLDQRFEAWQSEGG